MLEPDHLFSIIKPAFSIPVFKLNEKKSNTVLWSEQKFNHANGIGRAVPLFFRNECWIYITIWLHRHESFSNETQHGEPVYHIFTMVTEELIN